jgi:hypothetical protein
LLKQYRGLLRRSGSTGAGHDRACAKAPIILAHREGAEGTLAIRPRTWIKRGERLVLLEELRVGHDVHMQAIEIAAGIP